MRTEFVDLDEWERRCGDGGAGAFHRPGVLRALDAHHRGDLRLVGGFEDDDLVAVLPVFVRARPAGLTILSPPTPRNVPRLGPFVRARGRDGATRATTVREFVDGAVDLTNADAPLARVRIVCPLDYDDPRPFVRRGFEVRPAFSYLLDLNAVDPDMPPESVDARGERRGGIPELDVRREGVDGVRAVYRAATDGGSPETRPVPPAFVRDLVEALGDRCRSYVARSPDGDFVAGIVVVVGETAHCVRCSPTAVDDARAASAVHRHAIRDLARTEGSVERYDFGRASADDPGATFGAALVPYYTVESPRLGARSVERVVQPRYH